MSSLGRYPEAADAYRAAARDTAWTALAIYRRARVMVRLGDAGAPQALAGFAQTYPGDTAAPTALYLIGDFLADRGDESGAERWLAELARRYPADPRSSLARFRLAAAAQRRGDPDSAARLYGTEVLVGGVQRVAARYWLARLARERGDTAERRFPVARARAGGFARVLRLARPASRGPEPAPPRPRQRAAHAAGGVGPGPARHADARRARYRSPAGSARAAGTGATAARRSARLERGTVGARVGLGRRAAGMARGGAGAQRCARVAGRSSLGPGRAAVEAEAREFGIDPLLFAAIVRQESTFDLEALSRAGARGLAQLMPGTAAQAARGLDVTLYPEWLTVPDLNLHLGAAHLAELLRRFGGRVEVAVAAYNAGAAPVTRWLARPGAEDPDQFIELIPFPETRGYVRSVLRNRDLYRALYAPAR